MESVQRVDSATLLIPGNFTRIICKNLYMNRNIKVHIFLDTLTVYNKHVHYVNGELINMTRAQNKEKLCHVVSVCSNSSVSDKGDTEGGEEIGYEYETAGEVLRWYHKGVWGFYSLASCYAVVKTIFSGFFYTAAKGQTIALTSVLIFLTLCFAEIYKDFYIICTISRILLNSLVIFNVFFLYFQPKMKKFAKKNSRQNAKNSVVYVFFFPPFLCKSFSSTALGTKIDGDGFQGIGNSHRFHTAESLGSNFEM